MTPLQIFRLLATEFSDLADDEVNSWIALTTPLISETKFGNTYNQALALLTAHRLKMAGNGDTTLGKIDDGLRVNSFSEGDTSIGYSISQGGSAVVDAEYTLTAYGLQFLTLRRAKIIPIVSSAEA